MQTLLDAGRGIWIVCAFNGMFAISLLRRSRTPAGELVARTLLLYTLAVPLASAAHLLNWMTALCLSGASIVVTGRIDGGHAAWLSRVAKADSRRWRCTLKRLFRRLPPCRRVYVTASLALISATAPFVQSLLNTRLQSEEYALLERSHRLMSGSALDFPVAAPSLVALASIISTADPLHVLRFLKPLLHVTSTIAAEVLVRRATRQWSLAYVTAALSSFALLGVQSSVDLLALTMLFAGLAILAHPGRRRFNLTGACGVLAMCIFMVPTIGIFAGALVATVVGFPRRTAPEALGIVLLAAAVAEPHLFHGATSLATCFAILGTALTCRRLLHHPVNSLARGVQSARFACIALLTAAVFLSTGSAASRGQYLEPDSTVRQTLALKESASRSRWMIVGTPTQRVQAGRTEMVMDLQEFVTRFRAFAGSPQFRFDLPAEQIFVFVEKQTVIAPPTGPLWNDVGRERAVYRIPRLRAELQQAALELCEAYRLSHAGVSIHYEDEELRIYSFAL